MRFGMIPATAALLCAAAVPAGAQERPRYIPTRDVVVQYALTSSQPGAPPVVVAHISASGHVRIEAAEHGTVLYDLGAQRARWLLPQSNIFVEIPVGNSLAAAFSPEANAEFHRIGGATVAGMPCTDWRVTAQKGSGTGCVTADGVILRLQASDARGNGSAVATSVAFEPQPAALFEPPPGSHRLDLPRGMTLPQTARP